MSGHTRRLGTQPQSSPHPTIWAAAAAATILYAVVGSGAGIAAFSAKQVDFGVSDVPMNATEQAAAKGGSVTQVPVALGGEGVVYHLDLPAGARVHLTGPVLARIFLGQTTPARSPPWQRSESTSPQSSPSPGPTSSSWPPMWS